MFDTISNLAGSASPVTNLIPGGAWVNTALSIGSKLGSFLSGKGGVPDHERGDIASISNQTGLTQDQVSWLCGMEESRSSANYDAIVKKYAANPAGLLPLIDEWNGKNPGKKIVSLESITPALPPVVYQLPTTSAAFVNTVVEQAPTAQLSLTANVEQNATGKPSLGGLAGAVIKGAGQGATDWAMETDAGKEAKNQGAISWAKDNIVAFVLGGLLLGGLIFKAFFSKK